MTTINPKLKEIIEDQQSEEIQHIINRMPTTFSSIICYIISFIFISLLLCGWIVKYPDVIIGNITINTNTSPIKLIASSYGKLKLGKTQSLKSVREGELIAYIENSAAPEVVLRIDSLTVGFNPNIDNLVSFYEKLPQDIALGELNTYYFSLIKALQDFKNSKTDQLYDKQSASLKELITEQTTAITAAQNRVKMSLNNLTLSSKFFKRDSILFVEKVISEADFDKTQINYISAKDGHQNALNNLTVSNQQLMQTESKLQELQIAHPEKNKEIQIAAISAFNDLIDNIQNWKRKYLFISPFAGKIQFLKFYSDNQYIQSGEPVFAIIPEQNAVLGQVMLPATGAGKLKNGQEVIVKLDNFPYLEYGSVSGRVQNISLTTSTTKTDKSEIEVYLISVEFPRQLTTNYGVRLEHKAEAKGTAEIITNDRRLLERLFDNLKYVLKR
ncbi:HlyD family secretion protein [Chitinophaga jiangningensis]|uniref:HlyD family secretion protein n=1 Tax=Chitinophaga jiangningensis TaxID=1419482 RepID=A0A1M7ITI7_9BACT|nr:HlyD family efflux transporter periplasmic adaptor subunit [Chitinophaga jiangningensis]SHM43627.1 HlyD family secretion protein [Chitinophaga jiangningensis]